MDCSPPGSYAHGILQARILEWVAVPLLQGIFPTQGLNPCLMSPALAGRFFTNSATWEAQSNSAAAAKLLQLCPTLCDPMDCSLPGFSIHGSFQARVLKWNTYATSTHFPCFLQNRSNYKTVLYLREPPTVHHLASSNGYRGHALSHRKIRCVFFKPWGSNLSQFFRIQFKRSEAGIVSFHL